MKVQGLRDKLVAIRDSQRKLLSSVPRADRPASAGPASWRSAQGQVQRAVAVGDMKAEAPGNILDRRRT